jgi:hypothetical protein
MRIASSLLLLGLLFGAAFLSQPALAQTAEEKAACQADFEKYCQGTAPGGGRIIACLAKHMSELSPACQKVVKANEG